MSLKNHKGREADSDPAGLAMGFTMVPHYAQYFWRPYLGMAAFAIWQMLVSFCYGSKDTAWPSISRLSRMLSNSDHSRHVVRGRLRRDHGRERFVPGALQVLEREDIVRVLDTGSGQDTSYIFKVRKSLPLLRPDQVSRLSPGLQRDHARYLARAERKKKRGALGTPSDARGTGTDDWDTVPDDRDGEGDDPGSTKNIYQQDQPMIDERWEEVMRLLSLEVDKGAWCWLVQPTEAHLDEREGILTITSPDRSGLELLEHRFGRMVRRVVEQVYGRRLELRFEWVEEE